MGAMKLFSLGGFILFTTSAYGGIVPLSKLSTHKVHLVGRGVPIEAFHPRASYETFSYGLAPPSSSKVALNINFTLEDEAKAFASAHLKINSSGLMYKSGFETEKGKFAYLKQYHQGVPFANAVANIGWHDGKVTSFGSSFSTLPDDIPSPVPSINLTSAIPDVEQLLGGKYNGHPPTLEYLVQDDGSIALTHVVQIQNKEDRTWYEAFVNAHTGKVLSVNNFVSHVMYKAIPFDTFTPKDGLRRISDPQDLFSSPLGWHDWGEGPTNFTAGNNVYSAFVVDIDTEDIQVAVETSRTLNFNYPLDLRKDPTEGENLWVGLVNAFYVANIMHDVAYRYGFTESTFNFQVSNFGKGGTDLDPIFMSVQRPGLTNTAFFTTLPDGQAGWCEISIDDRNQPRRDGVLGNDVMIHEVTHGISNRLIGGGTARCIQTDESRGLGEGYSDAFADFLWQSRKTEDFVIGVWLTGNRKGIRSAPYSTNKRTFSKTYKALAKLTEEHAIGEVWANMLHNVYADLVSEWGYSHKKLTEPDSKHGNVVMIRIFMDGLMLTPCNPTLIDARNAIIQADQNRYNGIHVCVIWRAFARLGAGAEAKSGVYKDDFSVPKGC